MRLRRHCKCARQLSTGHCWDTDTSTEMTSTITVLQPFTSSLYLSFQTSTTELYSDQPFTLLKK
jgi:hypothetical protein